MGIVVAVVAVVVLLATWVTSTAGRLDRLHARTDAAWAALDAQLVRRAAEAGELGLARGLERLVAAAHAARAAAREDREVAENALSRALRASLGEDPTVPPALEAAAVKVVLARRFYNDAVRDTLSLRRTRLVRWLRLAGRAPLPEYFEIDDTPVTPRRPERTEG